MSLNQVIVALDQMDLEEIDHFLCLPDNKIPIVKIGLELYLKHGQDLVHKIHQTYKKKIFLDLKLHDIPITVERAIASLENLPIDFLTIHLGGGAAMMKASMKEAQRSLPQCKILGVSFLTSLEEKDLQEIYGIHNSQEAFLRLFSLANQCGIHGVVCSSLELALVKNHYPELLTVTPGIRFKDELIDQITHDQKRVATPQEAITLGADFLVMGRSLTKSKNFSERIAELAN